MHKLFQTILLSLLTLTLNASVTNPSSSYAVGDISIKSLFAMHEGFRTNYQNYNPSNLLDPALFHDIKIYVFFGTWCHDSEREVPRLLSLLSKLDVPENNINLIGLNFMKNDLHGREVEFQIRKTPSFIFFKNQQEIGRIVEKPEISLEADLLKILGSVN